MTIHAVGSLYTMGSILTSEYVTFSLVLLLTDDHRSSGSGNLALQVLISEIQCQESLHPEAQLHPEV